MAQEFAPPPQTRPATPLGAATSLIPDDIRPYLGAPPLLRGESEEEFEGLLNKFVLAKSPLDVEEWFMVWDQVVERWEEQRARRMRLALIDTHIPDVSYEILQNCERQYLSDEQVERSLGFVIQGMQRGNKQDAEAVDMTLASGGLNRDALAAASVVMNMESIEKIDRMLQNHRRRRREAANDLERHRFAVSQTLTRSKTDVTDLDPDKVVS